MRGDELQGPQRLQREADGRPVTGTGAGTGGDHRRVPGAVRQRAGQQVHRSVLAHRPPGPLDARLPPTGRPDRRLAPADEDPQPHRLLHGAAHGYRGGFARGHRFVDRRTPAREGQGGHGLSPRGPAPAARVPRVLLVASVRAAAGGRGPAPVAAAGTWFTPRSFTATEVPDEDGLLAPPETNGQEPAPVPQQAPMPLAPGELPPTMVDTIVNSLRATGARPPRQLWLPPLGKPAAADELVRLVRGKPWDVDYGKNPGPGVPGRDRGPAASAPPGRAFPGSAVRQRIGDRRTAVRRDQHPGHDDDDRGADVPAGARAVLLRGRRRSEPRGRRWATPCRRPCPGGGPRGRRPHRRFGAGHRGRA